MITRWTVRMSAWFARRNAKQVAYSTRTASPDVGIGAEAPIRKTSEDRLRRADFADRITAVLSELNMREGRVFAIRGGWGFGKSSLKNLIAERLDARENAADWLDFNPWQWGDNDAIARALFGQIADRLGGKHSKTALKRAKALRRYGAILTGASSPLKNAGSSTTAVSTVLTNASVIAVASAVGFKLPAAAAVASALAALSIGIPMFGRILSHFGRDLSSEPLNEVRKDLETRLRELDRPLVVFVDDIDRLEPEQIRMLLRQVKANANLPNIVFVLLFQPNIVERALDPVAADNGRAFLEKVVQASFDLPAVPVSTVHRIFAEELSEVAGAYATQANGLSQPRWGNALVDCIQPMLCNLRDARRLISSISVHLPLHAAEAVFEVNIVDFLVLETLRVFEPDLHEAIFYEKELLLHGQRSSNVRQRDEELGAVARLRDIASERHREIAEDILKFLFPSIDWAFGGTNHVGGGDAWLAAKRICTSRFFPRYFELQTSVGEISERRFVIFLAATASERELAKVIAEIETDGLLPSLATRLDETVDQLPIEHATALVSGMFSIAKKLVSSGDTGTFNTPWTSSWRATNRFLRRIPEADRCALAMTALRRTKALTIASMLIYLSDPEERAEKGEPWDPVLDLDTVTSLKREWLQLVRECVANDGALIVESDLLSILYRWRDYSGSLDEPREWVMNEIRTDEGFAKTLEKMMNRGQSHGAGDSIAVPYTFFRRETVDDFIGIDLVAARCEEIDPAEFPEHEETLRMLQSSVDRWLNSSGSGRFDDI